MSEQNMRHMDHVEAIALLDAECLRRKEVTYQGSWKKRGGVGAFMMLARKWDRLEQMMLERNYDVFNLSGACAPGEDGSTLAEIRDLRRYLLLVEAELVARGTIEKPESIVPKILVGQIYDHTEKPGTPADGGHHEKQNEEQNSSPWLVTIHDLTELPLEIRDILYRTGGALEENLSIPEVFKLEMYSSGGANNGRRLVQAALSCYQKNGVAGLVLDMARCPPEERDRFCVLRPEQNHKELTELPAWQQPLYEWHGPENKYRIRPEYAAWTKG